MNILHIIAYIPFLLGICACENTQMNEDNPSNADPEEPEAVVFSVEGETAIPATGGTLTFNVEHNSEYTLDIPVDWIRQMGTKAVISEQVLLVVDPNESIKSRSASIVFNPEGAASKSVVIKQDGVSYKGIATAADFIAFAEAVNSGKSLERFCNEAGEVVLLNDIDLKGYETVPVGMPSSISNSETSMSYEGASFKGIFNGQGHCISNINLDKKVAAESTYGLFGVLDGGTVRNLVLGQEGDGSAAYILAAAQADAAVLVGTACNGAVIENCVNNVPLVVKGTDTNGKRFSCGVFVGYACSNGKAVSLNSLVNNADIKATSGANTYSTASGVMVGGIAGFCTGSDSAVTMIESCENKGNIDAKCGRSAGIVATMNANSMMRYCINRGNQTNTFEKGRIANLCCAMGNGCSMDDCTNYGEVITSDPETTTGGMVATLNGDNVVVSGGGNFGRIISANEKYHGLLVANFSKFASVKGCYAGGSCGTYSSTGTHQMHELTADNWIKHIGYYSDANYAKITDISSPWGSGGAVEGELPQLKDASLR
ncbi:MAG: BACON domain-containing protein, partial [Candidatus Cryptobacteroides sp.]